MVVAGRRKSIALYIALCAGLILVSVLLYVGWIVLSWRSGALLFLGVLLLAALISGVVLNTFAIVVLYAYVELCLRVSCFRSDTIPIHRSPIIGWNAQPRFIHPA